jgi:hypothetical protein
VSLPLAAHDAADIEARRADREASLARWERSVGALRQHNAYLNYFTVHQLMTLADSVAVGFGGTVALHHRASTL